MGAADFEPAGPGEEDVDRIALAQHEDLAAERAIRWFAPGYSPVTTTGTERDTSKSFAVSLGSGIGRLVAASAA